MCSQNLANFIDAVLKEHLKNERDYLSLPAQAWDKLVEWYGMTAGSRPIPRVVVEYGLNLKLCEVEVYPLEFKLCVHPHLSTIIKLKFSREHTASKYWGIEQDSITCICVIIT